VYVGDGQGQRRRHDRRRHRQGGGRYLNGTEYRPAHIHLKVWVGGVERLTTQIYFEGDPYLESDLFVEDGLVIPLVEDGAGGLAGEFPIAIA